MATSEGNNLAIDTSGDITRSKTQSRSRSSACSERGYVQPT
jgi:hypothetical protein